MKEKKLKFGMMAVMAFVSALPTLAQTHIDVRTMTMDQIDDANRKYKILTSTTEWELWGGWTMPAFVDKGDAWGGKEDVRGGIDSGVEVRYNFPESGFALGGQFSFLNTTSRLPDGSISGNSSSFNIYGGLAAEYNFRQGKNFNPYIGTGLGFSVFEGDGKEFKTIPYLKPKVGIEIKKCLRLGVTLFYNNARNMNIGFNVGAVIGGWPKSTYTVD